MRKFNKIFCIGLTKTGTNSVTEALNKFSLKIRHYPDSEESFDKVSNGLFNLAEVNENNGISDVMAATFYQEFDLEYPGSLFILTVRDEEEWIESARKKLKGVPRDVRQIGNRETQLGKQRELANFLRVATYGTAQWDEARFRNVYNRHIFDVARYFRQRPGDLLVLNVCDGTGGWPQLCTFLDVKAPMEPFPHLIHSGARQKRESREAKGL